MLIPSLDTQTPRFNNHDHQIVKSTGFDENSETYKEFMEIKARGELHVARPSTYKPSNCKNWATGSTTLPIKEKTKYVMSRRNKVDPEK